MQNYKDLVAVGQGQFGVAYKATNKQDGQLYCIKRIPMKGNGDEQAATLKEAQLLSTLDHPNIIGYKECFIDSDESLCIVTSFCEEGDLFKRIQDKSKQKQMFEEDEIMDMFIQIASSLMYIHAKKILHRDLKTQNIFIARGSIMKLGDFGIAKVLEKTDSFAQTVTGTPYYMAPEICSSQPYTFKSDIWSLGCVLHAFAADSLLSLVYQIVRGNFPPIPKDQFSPGLSDLVNALLVRDPNARPTLQQVFQMPYVQQHVQRYHKEEKKRAGRAVQSATRRRQIAEEAKSLPPDPEWEKMTPKERMVKKREMVSAKRELELKIHAMNATRDRGQAAGAKAKMIHESNVGLPGAGKKPGGTASADNPWDVNTLSASTARRDMGDASMVNMDTMPSGGGGGGGFVDPQTRTTDWQRAAGPGPGSSQARGGGGGTMRGGGDTVLMGSVMSGAGGGGLTAGYGGDTMVNLGTMNLGTLPTLPGIKRQPMGIIKSQPASPIVPKDVKFSSQQVNPKKDDYESDYASEYESDFEDDDDVVEGQVNQRMQIISHVEQLERTAALGTAAGAAVQERVGSAVKNGKAQALRDRCQEALGFHFATVYAYLRKTRSAAATPPDEREVQKKLLEIVGNRKDLMPGCFMVDQLVFTESMH